MLEEQATATPAIDLLREAFDMLEEDLEEEQFFVDRAPRLLGGRGRLAGARRLAAALIQRLEF